MRSGSPLLSARCDHEWLLRCATTDADSNADPDSDSHTTGHAPIALTSSNSHACHGGSVTITFPISGAFAIAGYLMSGARIRSPVMPRS
jgi:hypothetical protein